MCVSGLSRGGRLLCSRLLTGALLLGKMSDRGISLCYSWGEKVTQGIPLQGSTTTGTGCMSQGQVVIFSLSFLCVLEGGGAFLVYGGHSAYGGVNLVV